MSYPYKKKGLEGAGDDAPKPEQMLERSDSKKIADAAATPVAHVKRKIPSTTDSPDSVVNSFNNPAQKVQQKISAKPYSGAPGVKVKEPEELEQTSATRKPWGKLHSMNRQLGNLYMDSPKIVIGRHRDCTLRLQGPLISGKHCTITRQIYGDGQIECYFILDTR